MRRALAALVGAALLAAAPAPAQQRDTATLGGVMERDSVARRYAHWNPTPTLVASGLLGGAVGLVGGALLGAQLEMGAGCEAGEEYCGLLGGFIGAAVGEALLLPLGVHLANGGQGSYGAAAVTSVGVSALGLALAFPTAGISVLAIPVAQLISSIRVERGTAARAAETVQEVKE